MRRRRCPSPSSSVRAPRRQSLLAKRMVEHAGAIIAAIRDGKAQTSYKNRPARGHGEQVVKDGKRYDVDCSGFIRLLFSEATGGLVLPPSALSDRTFARAKDWVNYLSLQPSVCDEGSAAACSVWRRVESIHDVIPGDIIAYTTTGGSLGCSNFLKCRSLEAAVRQAAEAHVGRELRPYSSVDGVHAMHKAAQKLSEAAVADLKAIRIDTQAAFREKWGAPAAPEAGSAVLGELMRAGRPDRGVAFWRSVREASTAALKHTGHVVMASASPFRAICDDSSEVAVIVPSFEATTIRNFKDCKAQGVVEWHQKFVRPRGAGARGKWVHKKTRDRAKRLGCAGRCRVAIGRIVVDTVETDEKEAGSNAAKIGPMSEATPAPEK